MMAPSLLNILSLKNGFRITLIAVTLILGISISQAQVLIDSIYNTNVAPTGLLTYTAQAPSDRINDINTIANTSNSFSINHGQGDNLRVDSLEINNRFYTNFLTPDRFILRRTDNDVIINVWYQLLNDPIAEGPPYTTTDLDLGPDAASSADDLFKLRFLNAGYDNILVNDDDDGQFSIQAQTERVDIIWDSGIVTCEPDSAVFPIIERINTANTDDIKVAAITSLDINGDPDEFSDLVSITTWPTDGGVELDNYLILKRTQVGSNPLPVGNIGTFVPGQPAQLIQGVAVSFTELGIQSNQVVYGYSLFAGDVATGQGYELTDFDSYPKDTKSSDSGLDLIAGITAAVSADDCLTPAVGPGGYKAALATWLKANGEDRNGNAEVTASTPQGASVTDWQDHWIGDNDFTTDQGTPTYNLNSSLINFNPSVEFASASLTTPNNEDFNSATFYTNKSINIAFRTPTLSGASSKQVLFEQGDEDRGIIVHTNGQNVHVSAWNQTADGAGAPWNSGATVTTITSGNLTSDNEYILTLELNGNSGSTGTLTAFLNGQSFGTPISNVGLLYDHSSGDITLGSSDNTETTQYNDGSASGANSFEGEIAELVYCNEPSNFILSQRRRIESYLAIKYGITLDQATPINYLNSEGTVVFNTTLGTSSGGYLDYNADIAGIARDDGSELSQLQSKSENPGSVITMERTTAFGSDNIFLMWGNDAGNLQDNTTTNLPNEIGRRLDRVWRIAETGEAGAVNITFDISGMTLTGANYTLLIADNGSDGDFSNATVITGGNLNGNDLTFEDVDLSNGEFITIGTAFSTNCGPGGETTNLALWLKANLGTNTVTENANVTDWTDLSGNGNNAGTGTAPSYLSNQLNFNPTLDFDAANNEFLTASSGFYSQGYFIVLIPNSDITNTSPGTAPVSFYDPSFSEYAGGLYLGDPLSSFLLQAPRADSLEVLTHYIYDINDNTDRIFEQNPPSGGTTRTISQDVPLIINVKSDDPDIKLNENGELLVSSRDLNDATVLYETGSSYTYNIGADDFDENHFDGKIAEVISYSTSPTDLSEQKIQSYLALKYGITISNDKDGDAVTGETVSGSVTEGDMVAADGGIIWDYSTNINYHNNVAGIGKDDNSCLEQKQSKSENDGSMITMGLGEIATSNKTNPNNFSADDSFLIWGKDATAKDATPVTTQLPSGVSERMAPIWRVDKTGTVDDVDLSFDLTGLGDYTSRNSSDYRLIIASSGETMPDLTNASTFSGGTFNGDVLTFEGVSFTDGDYFTLGTAVENCSPGGVDNVSSSLELWLKADEAVFADLSNTIVTDGGDVAEWADQSGSGFDAQIENLGGGNIIEPTWEDEDINFNPSIKFYDPNSTNGAFLKTIGTHAVDDDLSIVVLFRSGQTGGSTTDFKEAPVFVSTGDEAGSLDYGLGMSAGRIHMNAANNDELNTRSGASPLYNTLEPIIATGTRVQAASGAIELYANSNNIASTTNSVANDLNAETTWGIGNNPDQSGAKTVNAQLSGNIAEVIIYDGVLSATERQRVESYLAIKYGITRTVSGLAASEQDYESSTGATFFDWDEDEVAHTGAEYRNDIAGVGRDDGSCLNQIKSKSENNDAIVTMEVGTIANDAFMMWANNGDAMESADNREFNQSLYASRLNREWKVQETNTVGAATITFDLSEITGPTGIGTNNLNQVVMLVDDDGDFTTGETAIEPLSIDAVNKTVTFSYNFANEDYFTLASTEEAALPVELLSFNASALSKQVYINWTTATETDNSHFVIERSQNGETFESIGEVDGAGESSTVIRYSYQDRTPFTGRSYYRLKQVDYSGTFSYSETKSVQIISDEKYELSIHPNPIANAEKLTINYALGRSKTGAISIVSVQGRVMLNREVDSSSNVVSLSIQDFSPGIYLVILKSPEGLNISKRLIVDQ